MYIGKIPSWKKHVRSKFKTIEFRQFRSTFHSFNGIIEPQSGHFEFLTYPMLWFKRTLRYHSKWLISRITQASLVFKTSALLSNGLFSTNVESTPVKLHCDLRALRCTHAEFCCLCVRKTEVISSRFPLEAIIFAGHNNYTNSSSFYFLVCYAVYLSFSRTSLQTPSICFFSDGLILVLHARAVLLEFSLNNWKSSSMEFIRYNSISITINTTSTDSFQIKKREIPSK